MVTDDELLEIRRKKLLELQRKLSSTQENQETEGEQITDQIRKMEIIVKSVLEREAKERLNNIKLAHPEKYLRVISLLYQNIVLGRITRKITDKELKRILEILFSSGKRKTKIRFIHEYK